MLREITIGEMDQVAGGLIHSGQVEIFPTDFGGPTGWFSLHEAGDVCGPTAGDFVPCGDGIIINGEWRTLDLDEGREIRFYLDGSQALYVNDKFISRVVVETGSIINGAADWSASTGETSAGFGYSPNNSSTVNYRFVPGD